MKKGKNTKIYLADTSCLKDKELFNRLYDSVLNERKEKIDKLRFESDKRLSLGAGILLKKAVIDAGLNYNNLNLVYEKNKKPYIKGNRVYFSLSHSGDFALCAISDSEVGADIEKIKNVKLDMAQRIYRESECKKIFGCKTKQEQNEMFIRLWTLKESYMKLKGEGLSLSPLDIPIVFEKDRPYIEKYYFFEYAFEGYRVSCCSEYDNFDMDIRLVSLNGGLVL